MRNLILILGDQLDHDSAVFDEFDASVDEVWMSETAREVTHVWCHQLRIAMFFAAMRHFRDELRERDITVNYHQLTVDRAADAGECFGDILSVQLKRDRPEKLIVTQPGDYRVQQELTGFAEQHDLELEILPDRHFYCSPDEFAEFAEGRKELRLEYFYRGLRKQFDILVEPDGSPVGGDWNYDSENRESFGKSGPEKRLAPMQFQTDPITEEVLELVRGRFADHPGTLKNFQLPVTQEQARRKLTDFIRRRLPTFGTYEDAMWTDEAFLYHSHLSACLNMKLLNPRECVDAAVAAYHAGDAPLNSVEGFVRQILGWREFIRGVYWLKMPEYEQLNHFEHQLDVPDFFWNGDTEMACVRDSMAHVVKHGYAHHIHRLMVLGNLAQIVGVDPHKFHEWHMAMYLDAIDWVSLPNALGMSQFGDGGIVGSKPYCASGNYINKMGNYCKGCRFNYKKRTGDDACPFTTLYWNFLDRNYDKIKHNMRMNFQIKNIEKLRKNGPEIQAVRDRADQLREQWYN